MNYVEIRTSTETMKISRMVFGTHHFGMGCSTYEDAEKLIDCYLSLGGNVLDTARCPEYYHSEEFIGKYFKKHPEKRKQVYICTKWGNPAFSDDGWMKLSRLRFSEEDFRQDLEESFEKLQMPYVDIYLLHKYSPSIEPEEIITFMNKPVREGRVKHIGVSNWPVEAIERANLYAGTHGLQKFEFSEVSHSLYLGATEGWGEAELVHVMEEQEMAEYNRLGIPVFCFSSLAGGFFVKNFSKPIEEMADQKIKPENIERLKRVRILCEKKNMSPLQVVLGFFTGQPFTAIPVTTSKSVAQLTATAEAAANAELTREEVRFLIGKSDFPE